MPGAGLLSIAMRKAILVILTSAAALSVACAGIESAANRNPDATQNQSGAGGAKTVLAPPDLPRVVKKEGWLIPGLEGSRVHDDRVLSEGMSSDTVKVYVTGLAPGDGYIIDVSTYIGEGYQVPEPARKKKLEVHRITRWDVGGRVFCYVLTVGEPGLGLLHALTFRDEDGDGRFEVVSEGDLDPSAYSPPLPDWSVK